MLYQLLEEFIVEVVSTPFSSVFAGMTIENSEESLTLDACIVDYERVSVFHCAPGPTIVCNSNSECGGFGGELIYGLNFNNLVSV